MRRKGEMLASRWDKVLRRVLDGRSDHNIPFDDLRGLLLQLGFDERINGAHHVFGGIGIREIIDIQPQHDGKAKGYQVRQVRDILRKYGLTQMP